MGKATQKSAADNTLRWLQNNPGVARQCLATDNNGAIWPCVISYDDNTFCFAWVNTDTPPLVRNAVLRRSDSKYPALTWQFAD